MTNPDHTLFIKQIYTGGMINRIGITLYNFFPINFIVLTMIFFAIVFPMEYALRYIGLFWLVNSSDYNFFKKVKFTNAFWLGTIDDPFLEEFYKELNNE